MANALLLVCVNGVGIFHLWMSERDRRKSNRKREQFSAIRSRKEIRKYQQVGTPRQCRFVLNEEIILVLKGKGGSVEHKLISKVLITGTAWVRSLYALSRYEVDRLIIHSSEGRRRQNRHHSQQVNKWMKRASLCKHAVQGRQFILQPA